MGRPLVLFAIPELDAGGPDRVFHELLHRLPRDRFRLALAVTRTGGRYFGRLPGDVAVREVNGGRYPCWSLARAIDAVRPDILLTTLRMNLTAAFALPLTRHRPLLLMRQANAIAHDFAILKQRSLLKHRVAERATHHALRTADAVIAQSAMMAEELRPLLRPHQTLEIIGNPVDIASLEARATLQSADGGPPVPVPVRGAPSLLALGRLAPQKGFDLLIGALPAIRAVHPRAELTIAGDGPDRAMLAGMAERLGLAAAVHLIGGTDTPESLMRAADLIVSSSRYEGFSNVILEALALARPVVATGCAAGSSEMIIDGTTGWLAPAASAAALSEAVLRALAGDRAATGSRGRARVAAHWSADAIAARYADALEGLSRDCMREVA